MSKVILRTMIAVLAIAGILTFMVKVKAEECKETWAQIQQKIEEENKADPSQPLKVVKFEGDDLKGIKAVLQALFRAVPESDTLNVIMATDGDEDNNVILILVKEGCSAGEVVIPGRVWAAILKRVQATKPKSETGAKL